MNKSITLLLVTILLVCAQLAKAQVNYTANEILEPYDGYYHPGINLGYYGPNWDDNQLADLSAGNETVDIPGIGVKALRGSLPEGLGLTFTYDIWKNKYNYNNAVGTTDNLLFLGFASDAHKDPVDYCPSDEFQTDMFANLYEPIWDNGENGTPVNDENYYALYVYEVVSRLKDRVKFWEIWNEPGFDFSGAKGFLQPGQPGNWWENNPDPCDYKLRAPIFHYIRTLRISYEVIKSIAPDDYVCVAGLGYDSFLDAILRNTDNPDDGKVTAEYPLGGGAYFDVVGFHAYPHIDGSTRYWDNNLGDFVYTRHSDSAADALKVRTDARQEVLERYGYDGVTYPKKEWIATEVNVPSTAFTQEWGSQEVQRNYVMKVNIEAMELDYTQLHLFLLADFKTQEEAGFEFDLMGMYESISDKLPYEQVVKESGIGLKTMSDALYGSRYDAAKTAEMNIPSNVDGGAFLHEDGTYTYALWAKTQTDLSEEAFANYTFPASFGLTAMIRKEWNFSQTNSRIAEASGGIQLTASPIFLRRLEEDQDIFLSVNCDMGVEFQITATTPEGGQIVSWEEPTAQTNCTGGVSIEQTQGIQNGGFFPFGVSEIQYTITNKCGDVKYCAFNVKVASTGGGIGDCNLFRWEMGFVGQFEGNKYFVSKVKKNFAEAQAQCAGHGGYLVSIDSPEENEFLRQQVNDLAQIGYNDVAQEGVLEWTSGKEVVYTNVADCQGCSNSEAGDVAMFNHFNGEWYFIPSTSQEYFIMELPCAEVPPCVCTTDYDPVCGPDGTEYSNSCFAECAGVFNYGACQDTCMLSELDWLTDLIDQYDCGNPELEISSFESNGSTFVLVDIGTSLTSDGDYSAYNCAGTTVCTETGINTALCTELFGADFAESTTLYYSAVEECPCVCDAEYDPVCGPDGTEYSNSCIAECEGVFDYGSCAGTCDFLQQEWVTNILDIYDCDNLDLTLSTVEINGASYLIVDDGSSVAVDGGYIVYDCEQNLICTESGFGSPLCLNEFGQDFPNQASVIWEASIECTDPCIIEDQDWYQALLSDSTLCDNECIATIESFDFGDSSYVAFMGHLGPCADFFTEIYNCEQTLICQEGGFAGLTECSELFGDTFPVDSEIIWSIEDCIEPCSCTTEYDPVCGPDGTEYSNSCFAECEGVFDYGSCAGTCDFLQLEWVTNILDIFDCNNLDLTLSTVEINGASYLIVDDGSSIAVDGGYIVYDCEENLICTESGDGSPLCLNVFGQEFPNQETVIWDANVECVEPCTIEDQEWVDEKIEALDCVGCIESLISFEWNDSTFVAELPDEENCDDLGISIYDCNGDLFCFEGGKQGSTACSEYFGEDFDPEVDTLWSKEAACEDCTLDEQEWLAEKLEYTDCASCVQSISTFELEGVTFVAEEFIEPNTCSDTVGIVYTCDGEIFCFDGGPDNITTCSEFFEDTEPENFEVLWSRDDECEECEFEDQEWLENKIDSLDCNGCTEAVFIVELEGEEYVFETPTFNPIECPIQPLNVYDCEGNLICQDGNGTIINCAEVFKDFESPFFIEEVFWSKDTECEDCNLNEQAWLDSLLLSESLCDDCISSIEIYSFLDFEYVVAFGDNENCVDALTTGYKCDGTVLCSNGGITGSTDCNPLLFQFGEQTEVLWEKEIECIDNAVRDLVLTGLNLFPNPADDEVQISFDSQESMQMQYTVLNITGQVMIEGKYSASSGSNKIDIDLEQLVDGMYLLRLVDLNSSKEKSLKLVIQ